MLVSVVSTSTDNVVTLDLAKQNSFIDDSDQDVLLQSLLNASVAAVEQYLEKTFRQQVVKIHLNNWGPKIILNEVAPIINISGIEYQNEDGDTVQVSNDDWELYQYENGKKQNLIFLLETEPTTNENNEYAITINATIGETNVPDDVVAAVLLEFSALETFREDRPINELSKASRTLLRPHRNF